MSNNDSNSNSNKYDVSYENLIDLLNKGLIDEELKCQLNNTFRWDNISIFHKLSESFIKEFHDKVDWYYIIRCQTLSEDFIREFQDMVNWENISMYQILSEDFIREFQDKVDWFYISIHQRLSESFIREFAGVVDWWYLSQHQTLSEDFMREFKYRIHWEKISQYQKLSESFIREFKDAVDWIDISKHQKLSESFIREFKDAVDWIDIKQYQNIELTEEENENNKQKIIKTKNFECHDDYFIGFKAIRGDRYSKFNFQYQYLQGQIYESHADFTNEENSFGLSIGSEDFANKYRDNYNDIIIRVKCYYEDVARVVHGGEKIRATKIEILD